ncbi:sensor histidine kinase KdpD [cf. Phormidesmis sp. LEGE 11477]|uniref:sensor histidine kinase n=1 Tax=cf. Phormidesmis sp. LEGE 11477 TaxID=1828680 RepID=UPI00187E598A|nr:HAMP domain-containing sensor histidine kinase [cf. Phormidesmis sp. LEGE 11477]MBE9062412.1 HAMP domain-containing histidine kinase [cf. Phormidesmis sp. LEGE 11477]
MLLETSRQVESASQSLGSTENTQSFFIQMSPQIPVRADDTRAISDRLNFSSACSSSSSRFTADANFHADSLSHTQAEQSSTDTRSSIEAFAQTLELSAIISVVDYLQAGKPGSKAELKTLYADSDFTHSSAARRAAQKKVIEAIALQRQSSIPTVAEYVVDLLINKNLDSQQATKEKDWSVYVIYDRETFSQELCLLLWSRQTLSSCQKYCIKQQVRLMQATERSRREQRNALQRIKLLEQAIHRVEHQLRTPLSLVELYADLASQQSASGSVSKLLDKTKQVASEMGESLRRLTDCGQLAKRQPTECDLRLVIQECVDLLALPLQQKQIEVVCDHQLLPLVADRWQMKQVFNNLLTNAIAFSPVGSTIICQWQLFQQEVLIEIKDQGPGFSTEALSTAFKPFCSDRPGGTGLGLTIAQKLILDHHGSIWVNNLPEGGAQVSISLRRK